ncbi:DUF6879 family protein [Salinactinospora qingdaonensis]|uniref:DUF6879 domain-containing protein n=1 Tax=Salinactinospora qingdaonensis TaxID=702744 RepID=A0ABP7FXB1_9ACTN
MKLISNKERKDYFANFKKEALHLEMWDTYGTEAEKPHLQKWKEQGKDNSEWLKPWFDNVRAATASGKVFRRARIVSEPVTDYIRWVLMDAHLFVDAGEEIRWLPRRLASAIALPGNDFWLFDDETVIFSVFGGDGRVTERQLTTDPSVVGLCKSAFTAVWELAIPNHEYQPD